MCTCLFAVLTITVTWLLGDTTFSQPKDLPMPPPLFGRLDSVEWTGIVDWNGMMEGNGIISIGDHIFIKTTF